MFSWVRAALVRGLVLLVLWWVLIEGDSSYLGYALIAVPLVVGASLMLSPPQTGRWRGVPGRLLAALRLAGWVIGQIVSGGVDVALRAVARQHGGRISPVSVLVPVRATGTARAFCMGIFNLMPGTLVQGIRTYDGQDQAELHVLATELDAIGNWTSLEDRIFRVSGTEDSELDFT